MSLSGRTAVVTGGAAGIGLAIANRLAEAGASVVIADLRQAQVDAVAQQISSNHGIPALGVVADMRKEADVIALMNVTVSRFGRLDVVVNNAAIYPVKAAIDLSLDEWDEVHSLNLRAVFASCREGHGT